MDTVSTTSSDKTIETAAEITGGTGTATVSTTAVSTPAVSTPAVSTATAGTTAVDSTVRSHSASKAPAPGAPRPEVDVTAVLDGLEIVFQPIVDVATGGLFAMEALARFRHAPGMPVDQVFAQAHEAGFGYTLETACVRAAMARRGELPAGVRLSVNVSPDVVHHPAVAKCWTEDLEGVIIEITEHKSSNQIALRDQLSWLRLRGAQIAVDDVSTGYAGLLRLASMRPNIVKIDRSVVAGVHDSAAQSAVLEALVTFSHRIGAAVIGEGVETLDDLTALAEFDVDYGQGWAVGKPATSAGPISHRVMATCQQARKHILQRHTTGGPMASNAQAMHAVTSVLSNATGVAEIHGAVAQAARELGVDVIGVSVLGTDRQLREITSSGAEIDPTVYPLSEYPTTEAVLQTGNTMEIHVDDPHADAAERRTMERLGQASLLMIPFTVDGQPVGVLEFAHRTHRRWTSHDIAHGRGLAAHLGNAFLRIGDSARRPTGIRRLSI
jgi:EAL domain-containing protein (putative c-di-GMP-specific phosphodiesterase class I)